MSFTGGEGESLEVGAIFEDDRQPPKMVQRFVSTTEKLGSEKICSRRQGFCLSPLGVSIPRCCRLVNHGGFGAGHLDHQPPRFDQFRSWIKSA